MRRIYDVILGLLCVRGRTAFFIVPLAASGLQFVGTYTGTTNKLRLLAHEPPSRQAKYNSGGA